MTPKEPAQLSVPTLPSNAPPPAPVIANSPQGTKPGRKSPTPSFLNAGMTAQKGQLGENKLVGQA